MEREERERERKKESEREIGSSTKIPQLYIHALLIFALLKDLSATRSAVIPAAPEYRNSIKRREISFQTPQLNALKIFVVSFLLEK